MLALVEQSKQRVLLAYPERRVLSDDVVTGSFLVDKKLLFAYPPHKKFFPRGILVYFHVVHHDVVVLVRPTFLYNYNSSCSGPHRV